MGQRMGQDAGGWPAPEPLHAGAAPILIRCPRKGKSDTRAPTISCAAKTDSEIIDFAMSEVASWGYF